MRQHAQPLAIKLLRASPGAVIYADSAGLSVPTFRHVYAADAQERENVYAKLMACFRHLERHGLGILQLQPGSWPVFIKHRWSVMSREAQATLRRWGIPLHFFEGYLEAASLQFAGPCVETCNVAEASVPAPTCSATKGTHMTQQPSAVPTASAPGQALMDAEFPTDTKLVQTIKAFAEVGEGQESEQVASKPEVEKIEAYENVYKGQAKSVPANLAEATLEARRACQKAQPACSISFTTKRTVREGTWTAYKMWGACAECKPRCSLRARATIWIDGPAEGRVIVDCRGHHERKAVAAGGRLLPANVQNVVNEVIESGAPITTRSLVDKQGVKKQV